MATAKPFLKWAGGKQHLLAQFEPFLPRQFNHYFEPFVGSGALFFHLWNSGRITGSATLSDANAELINTYQVVRDEVEALIECLAHHEQLHSAEHFHMVRALDRSPNTLTAVERAARMVYLNRTCYNGLYRVNRQGHFNAPLGSYQNPKVLFADGLRAANVALQGVQLVCRPFEAVLDCAATGDFIYFDPPYDPVSKTASFTSYTASAFGEAEQRQLAEVFGELAERGCFCMLSNAHTPLILELYGNFPAKSSGRAERSTRKGTGVGKWTKSSS